jgi:hypothetical protein
LTKEEQMKIRIIIAQSVGIPPDDVSLMGRDARVEQDNFLYLVKFKGEQLLVGVDNVPTKKEIREAIKDMYLTLAEWDFDEDMDTI